MKNRFELEQHIMSCWGITSDLEALLAYRESVNMAEDELCNCLQGLINIYNVKMDLLFRCFEQGLKN